MPIWDNQMSIPDQSHTNPGPIIFQSGANQMPIQGHSLDQSRIIRSIFLPIQANPVPIRCQSDVIPRSTFRSNINSPISKTWSIRANPSKSDANPSQSNANFMPLLRAIPAIHCQFKVNPRTSCHSMPKHQLAFGWIGTVEANRRIRR